MSDRSELIRRPDWRGRLRAYASAAARRPFAYGQHDCALFAAGAIAAMTGQDPAADWRRRYTTLRGGLRVIRKSGHADHVAAVAACFTEIPSAFAQVGDLAVVPADTVPSLDPAAPRPISDLALGVVAGAHVWVLRPEGLGTVPLTMALRAFRT